MNCSRLKKVKLSHNKLIHFHDTTFTYLKNLKILTLDNNQLSDICVNCIHSYKLYSLSLGSNHLRKLNLNHVAHRAFIRLMGNGFQNLHDITIGMSSPQIYSLGKKSSSGGERATSKFTHSHKIQFSSIHSNLYCCCFFHVAWKTILPF